MNFFKKNQSVLKFGKGYEDFLDVVPIRKIIPQWYKNAPSKIIGNDIWNSNNGKACMPFLDSFTTGYAVLLPVDIIIDQKEGEEIRFGWANGQIMVVKSRGSDAMPTLPIVEEYNQHHYVWQLPCALEAPKGYSLLFTHPLNRFDLPFTTLSGIVDDVKMPPGRFPVLFKKNFSGILPAGTPIAQIIPFKRENWKIEEDKELFAEADVIGRKSRNVLSGFYKNNYWHRKSYD